MQADSPQKLRNVAVAGHNDTGKTTLVSALLYAGGVTNRLLRVEDGNTLTDFDHEETERRISIGLATCFVPCEQHKINLIDCPGYHIFLGETQAGLRAADACLLAVSGVSGVEVNTEKVWTVAAEMGLPVMLHLTKMDRERADFERAVGALQQAFGRTVLPVQLTIGSEQRLAGVVDLLRQKAWTASAPTSSAPSAPCSRPSASRCCRCSCRSAASRPSPASSTWCARRPGASAATATARPPRPPTSPTSRLPCGRRRSRRARAWWRRSPRPTTG